MNTVQKYCNIGKKHIQEFVLKNAKELGILKKNETKIVKALKGVTVENARKFYVECLKRLEERTTRKKR